MKHLTEFSGFAQLLESSHLQRIRPQRHVYHTSNPYFRDRIAAEGLMPQGRSAAWLSTTKIDGEVIFAVNSNEKQYVWDSTYDDDIYLIDTKGLPNTWYRDPNFNDDLHIITFEKIPLSAIKLIYQGTGKSR